MLHSRRRFVAAAALAPAVAAGVAAPAALAQSGEEAAVARAVEALNRAMVSLDKETLEALTAPELSYGHSAGRIENQRQFVDNLMSRNAVFRFINTSDQSVSVVGNDTIVRHMFVAETQSRSGEVTPVRIGVLQIWQKRGADWKLLARQAYRV